MMICYSDDNKIAMILGRYFRLDKKTGYYLASRQYQGKRKRLHVFIWEYFNGQIPKGYEVHHKDHNKSNNEISNLELLSESEHKNIHSVEMTQEQRKQRADNLELKARVKAIEWHKSEKGRDWHKKHYEKIKESLHQRADKCCIVCGNKFSSIKRSKFCSNKCKSAYRRAAGIDNVERECAICREKFITNKYSQRKYCEKHRHKGCCA